MREIKIEDIGTILQKIYNSEIDIKIGWSWDNGVDFQEGRKTNDFWSELVIPRETGETNICKAIEKISKHLCCVYPKSSFAQWFKENYESLN